MIPKSELLFYDPSKFLQLRNYYTAEGRSIKTITEFILNENHVVEQLGLYDVVDVSAFIGISQYHIERIIKDLADSCTFIADVRQKKVLTQDLRLCFDSFRDLEEFLADKESHETVSLVSKRKLVSDSEIDLEEFFKVFNSSLYGHEKFKDDFEELIKNFIIFNHLGEHKILSLFLLGDSGVGKTEVARAIHNALGGQSRMAKVNFGNYSSDNSLNSLIGSPRGYIGSDDGEIFIRVAESDTGVILIDEFEKSNSTLFNYFLDVLENGKMVSSLAQEIDLNGFIIIFTSNITKEDFKKLISPELRSRFDYKGYFSFLRARDKSKFLEFRVDAIIRKFNEKVPNPLEDDFRNEVLGYIDVRKFKNMRDLNKEIKRVFVQKVMDRL